MSGTYRYNGSELRIIELIIAWIAQIIYAEGLIQKELQSMGEDADLSIRTHEIKDAKKGLLKCRKQFPGFISCSPYFIFEELLMYRTGLLLPDMEHSLEMAE